MNCTTSADFEILSSIISGRRTRKADQMNGRIIPREWIEKLLQLADYAPTHGRTEPWRFLILTGGPFVRFCDDHAKMYWEHTPEEKRTGLKFEKLKHNADRASHLVIAVMKRSPASKIPEKEEYAATAAAVQNLLLGAEALGLAAIWSTGGMAYSEPMKAYLDLAPADQVVGFVYLGFCDEADKAARRSIPLSEKVSWLDQ